MQVFHVVKYVLLSFNLKIVMFSIFFCLRNSCNIYEKNVIMLFHVHGTSYNNYTLKIFITSTYILYRKHCFDASKITIKLNITKMIVEKTQKHIRIKICVFKLLRFVCAQFCVMYYNCMVVYIYLFINFI